MVEITHFNNNKEAADASPVITTDLVPAVQYLRILELAGGEGDILFAKIHAVSCDLTPVIPIRQTVNFQIPGPHRFIFHSLQC
jgi:hypothetical protein